jgi:WD40 repeat protein
LVLSAEEDTLALTMTERPFGSTPDRLLVGGMDGELQEVSSYQGGFDISGTQYFPGIEPVGWLSDPNWLAISIYDADSQTTVPHIMNLENGETFEVVSGEWLDDQDMGVGSRTLDWVNVAPDGSHALLTGYLSRSSLTAERVLFLYDFESNELAVLETPNDFLFKSFNTGPDNEYVAWSPDSNTMLISSTDDDVTTLWAVSFPSLEWQVVLQYEENHPTAISWSPDGTWLAAWSVVSSTVLEKTYHISFWHTDTWQLSRETDLSVDSMGSEVMGWVCVQASGVYFSIWTGEALVLLDASQASSSQTLFTFSEIADHLAGFDGTWIFPIGIQDNVGCLMRDWRGQN